MLSRLLSREFITFLGACAQPQSVDPRSSSTNVTLLGDACHPTTPYMAQGAAAALEDAAVLSRCLANVDRDGMAEAFRRFEATRKPRTSRIQFSSRTNTWLRDPTDPDWVYSYDAWTAPLADGSGPA
jgi:6-hydroxynicotinate 3-monooxygenase